MPATARHSDEGAEVVGLIPVYGKPDAPTASTAQHADNARRILWPSMNLLLQPLLDTEDNELVGGFRCVILS